MPTNSIRPTVQPFRKALARMVREGSYKLATVYQAAAGRTLLVVLRGQSAFTMRTCKSHKAARDYARRHFGRDAVQMKVVLVPVAA